MRLVIELQAAVFRGTDTNHPPPLFSLLKLISYIGAYFGERLFFDETNGERIFQELEHRSRESFVLAYVHHVWLEIVGKLEVFDAFGVGLGACDNECVLFPMSERCLEVVLFITEFKATVLWTDADKPSAFLSLFQCISNVNANSRESIFFFERSAQLVSHE